MHETLSIDEAIAHEAPDFASAVKAVVTANPEELRRILEQSPQLVKQHSRSEHGATLLHYVASNAVEDALQLSPQSIYQILKVCTPQERGEAVSRLLRTVEVLLNAGAEVDAVSANDEGDRLQTPLNWLVSSGHPAAAGVMSDVVELFCQAGAQLDGPAGNSSPMTTALVFGCPPAVDVLVGHGCRTDNLLLAAAAGHLEQVQAYFDGREPIPGDVARCTSAWFKPPQQAQQVAELALVFACMCGRVDVARYLIQSGVDKNANPPGSHWTATPLHTACLAGQEEIVDLLIELECDPTVVESRYQGNAVHWAQHGGNLRIIPKVGMYLPEFLRKTTGRLPGVQALTAAVLADDLEQLKQVLAEHPLTPEQLDGPWFYFDAPAVVAAKHNLEMVDRLVAAGADINQKSQWWAGGFGVLHGASPELADALIQRGAKLDVWSAAELGRIEALKSMVEENPDSVHARGPDGKTALHGANSMDIAKYLVSQGADLDAKCIDHESTPAQYLVAQHPDVARYLVAEGCSVDIMLAAALGDRQLAEELLDADPGLIAVTVSPEHFPSSAADCIYSWQLGWHVTPHQVADRFGHAHVVDFLWERSPPEIGLLNASLLGADERAHRILRDTPDAVERLSSELKAQVAHAARNNETEGVRRLLQAGFPIDARGQHGGTPLHWAAYHGNPEMAQAILEHQPPLEQRDTDFDCTPLGWAREGCLRGWYKDTGDYPKIIQVLLAAGCQIDPQWSPTGLPQIDALLAN